jgi:hypothetical protein
MTFSIRSLVACGVLVSSLGASMVFAGNAHRKPADTSTPNINTCVAQSDMSTFETKVIGQLESSTSKLNIAGATCTASSFSVSQTAPETGIITLNCKPTTTGTFGVKMNYPATAYQFSVDSNCDVVSPSVYGSNIHPAVVTQ